MSDALIYLDYAATTPVDPRVAETLSALLTADGDFANPSSLHAAGRRSRAHVVKAAERLASLVNVKPERLIWTSGATESDNLAILGAARARQHRGKHLITMPTEHKAVTDPFHALQQQGFEVSWLHPDGRGRLDIAELEATIRSDTQLVSIMHVNNETGVTQDIARIGEICHRRDVLYHVDAAQSLGKLPLDIGNLPVDLVSMTAHKIYGPKGIGALYVADRPGCTIEPLLFGGGQQRRLRPGTLAVPLIAGFGQAAEIAASSMADDFAHLTRLRDRLWSGISGVPGITLNGDPEHGFPGILNVSVADIEGESLLLALEPLCVATGSACNSQLQEPSYVLRALGRSDLEAQSAIRFSLGRPTSAADVELAAERYREAVAKLRRIAPTRAE
ncbi:MAG: aminotransferase class V-fold PLP-dependent enzyme [Gammaproteobacteria bacterium]|nr:aminotransferase class V-fold PLP-dependent enzyme [Gammaproteobacteria bacterium]